MKTNKKGISLIVLIITIVVIIILATAIIVTLARTNVIDNANEATVKQDFRTLQDELDMYISDQFLDNLGDYEPEDLNADSTTNPTVYDILPSLSKTKYKDDVVIVNGKLAFKDTMNAQIKEWATEVVKDVGEVPKPYQIATLGVEVAGTKNATITGENATYSNPVIPVGFKAINTTDASWQDSNSDGNPDGWNDGLVIQDDNGNEFVWVPVDGVDVPYAKWCDNNENYDDVPGDLPSGVTENTQITKYGGFYVGRYEAGVPANQTEIDGESLETSDVNGTPQSKSGVMPWTYISYVKANSNAKLLYNNSNVKSGLLTGTQWDTVYKWIKNSGIGTNGDNVWGNFGDSKSPANVSGYGNKQVTGYSEYWKAKNIYDFAGNVIESTYETIYDDEINYRISRGGCFDEADEDYSMWLRLSVDIDDPNTPFSYSGFRIALYIM